MLPRSFIEQGWCWVPRTGSLLELAKRLGVVMQLPAERSSVQLLIPRQAAEAGHNSLSAMHGLGRFPFHTDLAHWPKPPRYIILSCLTDETATPTRLLSAVATERALRIALGGLWKVTAVKHPFLCSCYDDQYRRLRWDSACMVPANQCARRIHDKLAESLEQHERVAFTRVDWPQPDRALLIDNWRVLHARAPVERVGTRVIERIYLDEVFQ